MNQDRASQWGRWLAQHLCAQGESNPFLLAAKFGWQVVLENENATCHFAPAPLAEWDGSRRMIRLFVPAASIFWRRNKSLATRLRPRVVSRLGNLQLSRFATARRRSSGAKLPRRGNGGACVL
jgi:hypothetical protein